MHDDRSPDEEFSQWAEAASDRDLLARFVRQSDERAYSEIVRRHGTLVLGVCRRVLRDRHAAEDAFQATFLVLARSAPRIRKQRSLASWLHRVAYRISMRALAESRRRKEQAVPMDTVTSPAELDDVGELYEQQLLDEELQDLPPKYREPLVLHHLQGMSLQQVAERLGVTVSAVDGRLKRGRKELKLRLMRRGVEFGAVMTAIGLCQSTATAASIEPLIALATQSAAAATSGTPIPSSVSSQAASLAGKELTIMSASSKLVTTLGVSAVLVTLIGLTAGSAAPGTETASRLTAPQLSTVADASVNGTHGDRWLAQADDQESDPLATDTEDETSARLPIRSPTLDYSRSDPSTERIEEALDSVTLMEFPGNPLSDVVDYISDVHDISILLDEQPLLDAGISPDEEVSLVISGIRLHSAFEIMLKNVAGVPLDYVIHNEVLMITTREQADAILETRVYNLRHLGSNYSSEEVAEVVRSTIRPWTWRPEDDSLQTGIGLGADASGEVDIQIDTRFQASVEALPDALVVTQSQRIHREIVNLIEQLHRHSPESPTTTIIEAAINEQLDQPVEWEFQDVELRDALRLLSEDSGINIVLDEVALVNAGISGSEEISIVLSGITVRSALRILLADVGGVELTYFIEDEVIKVTTRAAAAATEEPANSARSASTTDDGTLFTRVYSVPDILWPFGEELPADGAVRDRLAQRGYAALITLISQIDPESWNEDAGIVSRHDDTLSLVVRQTEPNHQRIEQLLEAVRVLTFADNPLEAEAAFPDPAATAVKPALDPAAFQSTADVSISGSIHIQGDVPALPPLVVAGDPKVKDSTILQADVPDESLVVGDENGLGNVFVWLSALPDDVLIPPASSEPLVIASRGLRYEPHALIARTQEPIRLTNADPVFTNVHSAPFRNSQFNMGLPAQDLDGVSMEFDRQEPLPVRLVDDMHPSRLGYVLPLDHPFADLTDDSGRFNIRQLPPGDYELNIWHERVGYLERNLPVTVPEEGPAEFDLEFDAALFLESSPPT